MNNCAEWELPIALWVEGDGGDGVDDHLSVCPACRAFAAEMRESQRLLHSLASEPLPVGVVLVPRHRAWRWIWPAAAAACALLVVLLQPLPPEERLTLAVAQASACVPPASARIAPRAKARATPESNVIRMETEDENVVILWIADTEGDNK